MGKIGYTRINAVSEAYAPKVAPIESQLTS